MKKLRVAIIGTGMIANSAHFPALNVLRNEGLVDIVGVADIRPEAAEETAKRLAEKHKPQGLEQNKEVARMGGHAAKVAREDIERNLGESVVTKQNRLNYAYLICIDNT